MKRVTQLYTFRGRDVHPVPGGYEVVLTFQGMAGTLRATAPTATTPGSRSSQSPAGWQVDLFTTDNNGVVGVLDSSSARASAAPA